MQLTFDTKKDDLEEVQRVLDTLREHGPDGFVIGKLMADGTGETLPEMPITGVVDPVEHEAVLDKADAAMIGAGCVPELAMPYDATKTAVVDYAVMPSDDIVDPIVDAVVAMTTIAAVDKCVGLYVDSVLPDTPTDSAALFVNAQPMQPQTATAPPVLHWSTRMPQRRRIPWNADIHASTKTTTAKDAWKMKPGVDKAFALEVEQDLAGESQEGSNAHPVTDYDSFMRTASTIIRATGDTTTMTQVAIPLAKKILDDAKLDSSKTLLSFDAKDVPVELMQKFHDELEEACQITQS